MKQWSDEHPKAKLMAEKRVAILRAAREAFLAGGYEGVSMEAIAAAAGVSIMTLYRHAQTKDALFEAVVGEACEPSSDSEDAAAIEAVLQRPLSEILTFVGLRIQDRLLNAETLGLLRAVMIEHRRFPHLSTLAHEGLIASHVHKLTNFLAERTEARGMSKARRSELSVTFVDTLLGDHFLKALLGVSIPKPRDRKNRALKATKTLLGALGNLTS
jgi:TetR/AcrR family transcriptional repressor of mexJK operon